MLSYNLFGYFNVESLTVVIISCENGLIPDIPFDRRDIVLQLTLWFLSLSDLFYIEKWIALLISDHNVISCYLFISFSELKLYLDPCGL